LKTRLAILATLGLLSGQAMAEGQGLYAGGALAHVLLQGSAGDISTEAYDTGFKLFGGYQINENFAVELAYIDGGNPEEYSYGFTVWNDPSAIQASVIGTLPLGSVFGLYLRGSLLSWENETVVTDGFDYFVFENDGDDLSYGVGCSFNVGQKAAIRVEFEGADLDGTDVSILGVSGVFRF
jgi:OmpA-OmpF porin, OOP family